MKKPDFCTYFDRIVQISDIYMASYGYVILRGRMKNRQFHLCRLNTHLSDIPVFYFKKGNLLYRLHTTNQSIIITNSHGVCTETSYFWEGRKIDESDWKQQIMMSNIDQITLD